MNKSITTKTFSTFITTLKEELKQGFVLSKFDYRNGFFCGQLSNDSVVSQKYKDTLASINPEAKELVLKKIAELLSNEDVTFIAENEMTPYEKGEDIPNPMIRSAEDTVINPTTVEQLKPKRARKSKNKAEE